MSTKVPHNAPAHILQIKRLMAEQGITQAELARLLNRNQSAMSRRLRGSVPFRTDELQVIAERLGVSLVIDLGRAA
jgi:transcriptional regulator with XRE-family HTH domain